VPAAWAAGELESSILYQVIVHSKNQHMLIRHTNRTFLFQEGRIRSSELIRAQGHACVWAPSVSAGAVNIDLWVRGMPIRDPESACGSNLLAPRLPLPAPFVSIVG
jgi:hypothetical protein